MKTTPKPFVFVLMPFDAAFNDIYALGIRAACEDAGAYCERVDEQIFHESILQRIYNQISKADVIIADLTARNPNVFYETGYAHALGKQVVLLTQNADDIPFDLRHYSHIIYGGSILKLKEELERRVRWCIELPRTARQSIAEQLECYINGRKVNEGDNLSVPVTTFDPTLFEFDLIIAIHNAGNRIYSGHGDNDFGLIVPAELKVYDIKDGLAEEEEGLSIRLPDGRSLHTFGPLGQILPDGWQAIKVQVSVPDVYKLLDEEVPVVLRIFTEVGPKDAAFNICFEEDDFGLNPARHSFNPTPS